MTRFVLVSLLTLAACGGSPAKSNTPSNSASASGDGILTIQEGDRAASELHLGPDGKISTPGEAPTATLTANGELRGEDGQVMGTLHPDGSLDIPDWPRSKLVVRADGTLTQDGTVIAAFGKDGVVTGVFADDGMRIVASGDPAARGRLMAVLTMMMASLSSLATDGHVHHAESPAVVAAPPQRMSLQAVSTRGKLGCDDTTTAGVHGVLKDYNGTPLVGATIVVRSKDTTAMSAITDDNGCYMVRDLSPGEVGVDVYYIDTTTSTTVTVPAKGLVRVDGAVLDPPTDTGQVITIEPGN